MLPDKKIKCPYTGFAKSCLSIVRNESCPKWVHSIGMHPQTGVQMDRWDCADALVPLLLIENTNMQRHTAAAVESFRNEMVRLNGVPPHPAIGDQGHGRRIT